MEKLTVDSFDPMALDDLWPTPTDTREEDPDYEKADSPEEDPIEEIFDEVPVKKKGGRKKKVEEAAPPAEIEEKPKKRGRKKAEDKDTEAEEKPKPKRGRPPKPKVEGEEEKPKSPPLSIDDLDLEVFNDIFDRYSTTPVSELAKNHNMTEKQVHKVAHRLKEVFEMSMSTGDLTEEKFNEVIMPKLEPFVQKSHIEQFVSDAIKNA